jgi:3-oxoacyl-[acyl-carrier-protein] synthase-3
MPTAIITGTGHYVPPLVIRNDDLAATCDTSDAWIQERTGIAERRYAMPGQTVSELALIAAREALASASRPASAIDCILFATLSPEYSFPGSGCLLQRALGVPGVPAFDLRNQCSGFLYGLQMADAFIRAGTYRCVLLVGAEVHSTGLDFSPAGRDVAVLFGDGAGAVLVEAADAQPTASQASTSQASAHPPHTIHRVHLGADGAFAKLLWCDGPSSAHHPRRVTPAMIEAGDHFPQMRGREVFKHAARRMKAALCEVLAAQGLAPTDLRVLISHQANLRIIEMVRQMTALDEAVPFNNIQRYGNTTAASIPIALDECARSGHLRSGDWLGLISFGSGFTWGAALVRW